MQDAYQIAIKMVRDWTDKEVCAYLGVNYYDIDEDDMYDLRYHATIGKAEQLLEQNIVA